jgi:hypothetical protein
VLSARQSFANHDIAGGVIDLAGVGLSGAAAYKGFRAIRAGIHMKRATHTAVDAIEAGRGAEGVGLSRLADTKYSEYDYLVAKARESSIARHTLGAHVQALSTAGTSLNVVGLARSHATDVGIPRISPIVPARAAALGLP